jgi:hypothetical protein
MIVVSAIIGIHIAVGLDDVIDLAFDPLVAVELVIIGLELAEPLVDEATAHGKSRRAGAVHRRHVSHQRLRRQVLREVQAEDRQAGHDDIERLARQPRSRRAPERHRDDQSAGVRELVVGEG